MNHTAFLTAYDMPRDDAPLRYHLHCTLPRFGYSAGVHALGTTGCFSLIDFIGRECAEPLRATNHFFAHVIVMVKDHQADLTMIPAHSFTPMLQRHIDHTQLPDGRWRFCLVNEGDRTTLILPTEH